MIAKTRAILSSHRDSFVAPPEAGYQDSARVLRRVTLTNYTAGPLVCMPAHNIYKEAFINRFFF